MAKQILVVLVSLAILAVAPVALAQDQPEAEEKVFNLIVGDEQPDAIEEEVDDTPRYEPQIEPGRWSLALTLGFINSSGTLLKHENLIYRADDEDFYYGDVEIKAESAFNPIVRIGYNLTSWFALETSLGISFSEYESEITDPWAVNRFTQEDPEEVVQMGEFDRERRSAVMTVANLNGLFYPFNLDGDGRGRVHPYLTGGVGYASYSLDSDYTDLSSGSVNLNLGLGLMVIADDIITVRAEVAYLVNAVEFEPGEVFRARDGGTELIPVYEFSDFGRASEVEAFGSNSLGSLTWQLGFQLGF
jgi:opacity protein-like surface antigen